MSSLRTSKDGKALKKQIGEPLNPEIHGAGCGNQLSLRMRGLRGRAARRRLSQRMKETLATEVRNVGVLGNFSEDSGRMEM